MENFSLSTGCLNVHFARMGVPIFNKDVFRFARWLYANKLQIMSDTGLRIEVIHPVLTTSAPRNFRQLEERVLKWCEIKNELYNGQAGLQLSINSTSESQRDEMFRCMQIRLDDLSKIAERLPEPKSRKYCLNFAYATNFEIDSKHLSSFSCARSLRFITMILAEQIVFKLSEDTKVINHIENQRMT